MRSKSKFVVEVYFGKYIKGIGSTTSFTTEQFKKDSPQFDYYKSIAKRNNTTMQVIVFMNKDVYPKFYWIVYTAYFVKLT